MNAANNDPTISDLFSNEWALSEVVTVDHYWSGERCPEGRRFETRLLWSENAFYVRFDARQTEPLLVCDKPELDKKVLGLWDRDVCEIFIAPYAKQRNRYFEFEIAPTGEWVDLKIDSTYGERVTDQEYVSGMESAARIEKDRIVMAIKIPWTGFGLRPNVGDIWLGNIFRCVGSGETRGYLAWQPTMTKTPNFHVPERFGSFLFKA